MSNLVIVTGDFCSGSTLAFTLFRKTGQYYCLYEPLHELLREYLIWQPRPDEHDHHFFVDAYYKELEGFDRIPDLFNPSWGNSGLYLPPEAEADDLYRYLTYLFGTAFGRSPRVMFKENRLAFRLGWMRARFPNAKIVHIWRDNESQWKSVVRRAQEFLRREDIGQNEPTFNGFNVATFCEDLKTTFPELDAKNFKTGFERFCALWELSYQHSRCYADVSISYRDLTRNFEETWTQVWRCIGAPPVDLAALKQYVVPPEKQKKLEKQRSWIHKRGKLLFDKWGLKYARARVRAQAFLQHKKESKRQVS